MGAIKKENIKRVVVRGTNWVGDAVMTVPALRELRQVLPDAHITLVTRPSASELFVGADFLDEVLPYDRRGLSSLLSQIGEWRRRQFDLALIFQNAFEAALIPALARVPARIGYATEGRRLLLTHALPLPEWRRSRQEVFYYLNIVQELEHELGGTRTSVVQEPDTALPKLEARRAEGLELLRSFGVQGVRPVVALCPGSVNSRAKRWPAERYAALADLLVDSLQAEVLLIGSADELDVSLEVISKMQNRPVLLTGKTNLSQAVAILSVVDLLVTNDTGPAHIAPALGRPTLVIFGPTNPLTTRPFSPVAEIIRHPPVCAPCMLRDCPIDHRCMTAISPEEVFEHARSLLSGRPQQQPNGSALPTGAVA